MIAGAAAMRYKKRQGSSGNVKGVNSTTSTTRKKMEKSPQTPRRSNARHGSLASLLLPLPVTMTPNGNGELMSPASALRLGLPLKNAGSGNENRLSPNSIVNGVAGLFSESRKRSGSVPVLKFTLAVAWNLKSDHVRALKVTWSRLCDTPRSNCRGILAIMEKVFEKFECKEKTLKDVFYRSAFVDSMTDCTEQHRAPSPMARRRSDSSIATLRDHIHFFVSLISQVIQSLEKSPQEIFEHIDKIGCFHAHLKRYGFKAGMWDQLGVCLIDGLVVQDCLRGYPEACRAWTIMIAALIDRLRSAPKHLAPLPLVNGSCHFRNRIPSLTISTSSRPTTPTMAHSPGPQLSSASFNVQCSVANNGSETKSPRLPTECPMLGGGGGGVLRRSSIKVECNQRSQSHQRFSISNGYEAAFKKVAGLPSYFMRASNGSISARNSDSGKQ